MDQEKKYASFWLRFLAVAVDWIFVTIVVALFRIVLYFTSIDSETTLNLFIVFYVFFTCSYNVFCIYKFGATLGKRFAGIIVVKEEGTLTLFETIRREMFLKPISVLLFGVGVFTMFFNPKRQTYYDKKFHTVVLIKQTLSTVKQVFSFIIGFSFAIYLSTWTPFLYSILNAKNEQMKLDIIDGLNQKKEIMEVTNDPTEKQYTEYYKTKNTLIEQKMNKLCSKRILKILDKKSRCAFEDLDLNSLKEIDKLYEDAITEFMDVQTKVQSDRSKKFKEASVPSPEKMGWIRYTDPNNKYYLDYPKTFSAVDEGDNKVMFEKRIVTVPHGVDDYIFIQKGASLQWTLEEIEALKKMEVGKNAVIRSKDNPFPSKFFTFERLPDSSLGDKKIKSFISKSVWEFPEGTILYTYIYEGANDYIFGGLTDESVENKDNISMKEFKDIISTIHFN